MKIQWDKQHNGVHQAPYTDLIRLMPDIEEVTSTFPEDPNTFTWDVKVHMLMPGQFPCIPGWHHDNIPRIDGVQKFDLMKPHLPMYL